MSLKADHSFQRRLPEEALHGGQEECLAIDDQDLAAWHEPGRPLAAAGQ
jgi:hypothetical protein